MNSSRVLYQKRQHVDYWKSVQNAEGTGETGLTIVTASQHPPIQFKLQQLSSLLLTGSKLTLDSSVRSDCVEYCIG